MRPSASPATTPSEVEPADHELSRIANSAGSPSPRDQRTRSPPRAAAPLARRRRSARRPPPPARHRPSPRSPRPPPGSPLARRRQRRPPEQGQHRAQHHPERQRPAAAASAGPPSPRRRARAARSAGASRRGRRVARAIVVRLRPFGGAFDASRGVDDHAAGPLGQHGLERLAEQRLPGAPRRQRHHHRARADLARLLDDPPAGLARRTFSQWPVTRRPPRTRAESMIDAARASCSGICGVDRRVGGTVIVTSTWMPRRRRAASRAAVATASGE